MYTVLIRSKNTAESLRQFYPLFAEEVERGQISECQWVEAGDTVDTALPELYELVSRKRMWRAIIISTELEQPDDCYPADSVNPFDYLENRDRTGLTVRDGQIVECESPWIRLAHMLGGMPPPEPHFDPVVENVPDKVPRIIYQLRESSEEKEAYRRWCDEHVFRGTLPTEIIMIKVRQTTSEKDEFLSVQTAWAVHNEADSSEFWKRNLYPRNCRFLVFDFENRGLMRRQQDLFKLWLSVLLLAKNPSDPNALQAHRLYRLDIDLEQNLLEQELQRTVNSLNAARYQIEKSLRQEREAEMESEPVLPDYKVNVPLTFRLPKSSKLAFEENSVTLTGGIDSMELADWSAHCRDVDSEIVLTLHNVDRVLDHAAGRMRDKCSYAPEEVRLLSRYQEEDLNLELSQVYADLLRRQQVVSADHEDGRKEMDAVDREVRETIKRRMSRRQVRGVIVAAVAAPVLAMLPGFFGVQRPVALLGTILGGAAVVLMALYLVLRSQRLELLSVISRFQSAAHQVFARLAADADAHSAFFSSVASHLRGCSYLKQMGRKKTKRDSAYFFRQKHLKSIEGFLSRISLWSTALHVTVDMNSVDVVEMLEDELTEVDYGTLYHLAASDKTYRVPLNRTGTYLESPFGFVERIRIEREEVYDDGRD